MTRRSPAATTAPRGTEDDALISGTVPAATDVDVEPLTYHLVAGSVEVDGSPAPDGTVTFNSDGSYSYAPTLADQGLDDGESHVVTFNYVANDGTADSSAASVAITVNGVNDAPVSGGDDSASGTEDDALISGTVPAATDVDVEPLTYHLVSGSVEVDGSPAPDGTVTFNSDGSYSYAPTLADQGLDDGESHVVTFNYVANDGTADSNEASVAITVNGVNDAPVSGGDDSASGTEDDALDQRHRPGGDRRRCRAADLSSGRRLGRSRRLARARRHGDVQLRTAATAMPRPWPTRGSTTARAMSSRSTMSPTTAPPTAALRRWRSPSTGSMTRRSRGGDDSASRHRGRRARSAAPSRRRPTSTSSR